MPLPILIVKIHQAVGAVLVTRTVMLVSVN
jgi:hypothetical protein